MDVDAAIVALTKLNFTAIESVFRQLYKHQNNYQLTKTIALKWDSEWMGFYFVSDGQRLCPVCPIRACKEFTGGGVFCSRHSGFFKSPKVEPCPALLLPAVPLDCQTQVKYEAQIYLQDAIQAAMDAKGLDTLETDHRSGTQKRLSSLFDYRPGVVETSSEFCLYKGVSAIYVEHIPTGQRFTKCSKTTCLQLCTNAGATCDTHKRENSSFVGISTRKLIARRAHLLRTIARTAIRYEEPRYTSITHWFTTIKYMKKVGRIKFGVDGSENKWEFEIKVEQNALVCRSKWKTGDVRKTK